jgi:hypothetical protein
MKIGVYNFSKSLKGNYTFKTKEEIQELEEQILENVEKLQKVTNLFNDIIKTPYHYTNNEFFECLMELGNINFYREVKYGNCRVGIRKLLEQNFNEILSKEPFEYNNLVLNNDDHFDTEFCSMIDYMDNINAYIKENREQNENKMYEPIISNFRYILRETKFEEKYISIMNKQIKNICNTIKGNFHIDRSELCKIIKNNILNEILPENIRNDDFIIVFVIKPHINYIFESNLDDDMEELIDKTADKKYEIKYDSESDDENDKNNINPFIYIDKNNL